MGGGKVTFFPSVRLLGQFPLGIVNMHRDFRALDLGAHPKPILIAFKELLSNRLFLAATQIATPVILAYLKAFLDVWFSRLKGERLGVIHRSPGNRNESQPEGDKQTSPHQQL